MERLSQAHAVKDEADVVRSGQDTSTASKTTDGPRVSPYGDHTTRKYDNGHQPSGGETTWTKLEGHDLTEDRARQLTWRRHSDAFAQPLDAIMAAES